MFGVPDRLRDAILMAERLGDLGLVLGLRLGSIQHTFIQFYPPSTILTGT